MPVDDPRTSADPRVDAPATPAAISVEEPRGARALDRRPGSAGARERPGAAPRRMLVGVAALLAVFALSFLALLLGGVRPYLGGLVAGVLAVLVLVVAGLFTAKKPHGASRAAPQDGVAAAFARP